MRLAKPTPDNGIRVRVADPAADLDSIVAGSRWYLLSVDRPDIFPDPDDDTLRESVKCMLMLPGFSVLVAEHEGRVIAGDALLVNRFIWDSSRVACETVFWWCDNGPLNVDAVQMLVKEKRRRRIAAPSQFTLYRLLAVHAPDGGLYPPCSQHVDTSYEGVA